MLMADTIVCTVCGAANAPENKFCDQCGANLFEQQASGATPATGSAGSAAVVELSCVVCGATVLPGQAFCDNCGADLRTNPPISAGGNVSADSETLMSPPAPVAMPGVPSAGVDDITIASSPQEPEEPPAPPVPPAQAQADDATVMAPPAEPAYPAQPVASEQPTEQQPAIAAPEPPPPPMPPALAEDETVLAPGSGPPLPAAAAADAPAATSGTDELTPPPPLPEPEPTPVPVPATPEPRSAGGKTRQQLEEERERHRNTIAQMEQIIGAQAADSAPAYLTAALDDARRALAEVDADMATITAASGPDPAEVARLEDEIERHRSTIAQMEQIIGPEPSASTPAYLTAALDDARRALAQAEADLATLHAGGDPTITPAPSVAPFEPPEPAAPPAAQPRLVLLEDGRTVFLPINKTEITIGREDPVSYIFPEVDLTPFGGETGGVSRQHAMLVQQNNSWQLKDLNSTNYTKVDGKRLEPNVLVPVEDGTQIQFGRIAMQLKLS